MTLDGNILTIRLSDGFLGRFRVNVTASDGAASASQSFDVIVANESPVLEPIADRTMDHTEDSIAIPLAATDPDGDELTLEAEYYTDPALLHDSAAPCWGDSAAENATLSIADGVLTIDPADTYAGQFQVNVTASDGLEASVQSFSVTVENQTPVLSPIDDQTMSHGDDTLSVTLAGTDADGDALSYSAMSSHPDVGLTTEGDVLTLDPVISFVGQCQIDVTVSDGITTSRQSFSLTVTNAAPVLEPIPDQLVPHSQETITIALEASDPDGDAISYSAEFDQGNWVDGFIGHEGDQDWFSFNATVGMTYHLHTELLGLTDSAMALYDQDGTTLLNWDDDSGGVGASSLWWIPPSSGTYYLAVAAADGSASGGYRVHFDFRQSVGLLPHFDEFSLVDASSDDSPSTVFEDGAQRLSYRFDNAGEGLEGIWLEAGQGTSAMASWAFTGPSQSDCLVDLNGSKLSPGSYQFRVKALMADGLTVYSSPQTIQVHPGAPIRGSYQGETFDFSSMTGTGAVILGAGGTDTIEMGMSASFVASLNAQSLASFDPAVGSTTDQAIYRGTAFDFLRLEDGREIYFQGIERLEFSDGFTIDIQIPATDPAWTDQWNLHAQDVGGAWRFTQGSQDVLLVSLDTGVLTPQDASGGVYDLPDSRLITDPTDDDNYGAPYYGHGHKAISVMSAVPNNGSNIAGINWASDVLVSDVYHGVSFHQAVSEAINYARSHGLKTVFQGGVQSDYWLTNGGTREQLEAMIHDNRDMTLFAVAAGNYAREVDGVAGLQGAHDNVIAVGAATRTLQTVDGLTNAGSVYRAYYSNYGSNLTLMAATDVHSVDKFGNTANFNGTSAANPNMAGIASLVWSVNADLDGGDVRQTLIETAMDIDDAGWDGDTAYGLVNAEAAVRRALAHARDAALAQLADSEDIMVLHNGIVSTAPAGSTDIDDNENTDQPLPPELLSAVDALALDHHIRIAPSSLSSNLPSGITGLPMPPHVLTAGDNWHSTKTAPKKDVLSNACSHFRGRAGETFPADSVFHDDRLLEELVASAFATDADFV